VNIRSCRRIIAVGSHDTRIGSLYGCGLEHIEAFSLGHAFDDIDQNDFIGKLFVYNPLRGCGADIAGSDDGNLHGLKLLTIMKW
jgi:hypothetical protein